MNYGSTGLITVIDQSGAPVLFKVFPKHELLLEQEPVVNSESTAVAFMYMNPILTRFNHPLQAAVLLELLRQGDSTFDLAQVIESSFAQRRACSTDPRFWELVGQGLDDFLSLAGEIPDIEPSPGERLRRIRTQICSTIGTAMTATGFP